MTAAPEFDNNLLPLANDVTRKWSNYVIFMNENRFDIRESETIETIDN